MKIYHMIIEKNTTRERKEYLSKKQGAAPPGWTCVGVCGFHETTKKTIKDEEILNAVQENNFDIEEIKK